jgi:hypothetical protein
MRNSIQTGTSVEILGSPFLIKSMRVDLRDVVLVGKGGVERTLDFHDFYNQMATGEIKLQGHAVDRGKVDWTPSEYCEALYRKDLVRLVESGHYLKADEDQKQQSLTRLGEQHSKSVPSAKSIKAYQRQYAKAGLEGLIPRFSGRGGHGWSVKSRPKALAEKILLETFAKDDKLNVASMTVIINDALKDELDVQGRPLSLSVKTISRMIRDMPRDVVLSQAMAELARERAISSIDILFNPEDCTAIFAVHPDDGRLIRLHNKTVGIPEVSFAVAKMLKKAYSGGNAEMNGHDYQRVYARMLAQFTADSQRRPKIKANNKALREREKVAEKAEIAGQLEKYTPQPADASVSPKADDSGEDDFEPAPRRPQP